MRDRDYLLDDAIYIPDEERCQWCFDKARPTRPRAQLRVPLEPRDLDCSGEIRWVQLCLACWFKLAFR